MEVKFKKGQSVRITKRNGEIIDGIVRDWDYNWKSHSTLTLLATQNYPFLLKYDCPLWLK